MEHDGGAGHEIPLKGKPPEERGDRIDGVDEEQVEVGAVHSCVLLLRRRKYYVNISCFIQISSLSLLRKRALVILVFRIAVFVKGQLE